MTHIALITNTGWSMSRHRAEQIRGLVALGWRVTAIADYRRGEDKDVRALGATAIHVPCEGSSLDPAKNLVYGAKLIGILRGLRPDLVHLFSNKVIALGGGAARLAGVPAIVATVTGQGVLRSGRSGALKRLVRTLCRIALPRRAMVIFQNQEDRSAFIAAGIIPDSRTVHIPGCGVDVARLAAIEVLRPQPTVFVHASRMLWSKGVQEFIDAAAHVKYDHPEADFLLFGGSAEDYGSKNSDFIPAEWLRTVHRHGIVRWQGRVAPDVIEKTLLSPTTAAAVLLSRYAEGVPRFLIEAAACGLPVITTNHPGCRDVVARQATDAGSGVIHRSGYLCPPEQSGYKVATTAMIHLLEHPERGAQMGTEGRRHATQFDAERVLCDTLKVYERVL